MGKGLIHAVKKLFGAREEGCSCCGPAIAAKKAKASKKKPKRK